MPDSTWRACSNPGHWARPRLSNLPGLRWDLRICNSHSLPVRLLLLVQRPHCENHFFEGQELLGVPLPYLGLAPLQGPHKSEECLEGAGPRESGGFVFSSSHPSLPRHTAGQVHSPGWKRCQVCAIPTLYLITSVGETDRDQICVPGSRNGKNSDEAEESPKPEIRDGKGTWAPKQEHGFGGTHRPESGFLPGNYPDSCQVCGCGRPSSWWGASTFPAQCSSPKGTPGSWVSVPSSATLQLWPVFAEVTGRSYSAPQWSVI